jgi:hypothetical protein
MMINQTDGGYEEAVVPDETEKAREISVTVGNRPEFEAETPPYASRTEYQPAHYRLRDLRPSLMMKEACTSETSANFYQTTWRNIAEDSHLYIESYPLRKWLSSGLYRRVVW